MNRYFIEEVKCDWMGGVGPCCGPGVVTTSVKYRNEDGSINWLTLSEVGGMLYFFDSDEEYFEKFVAVNDLDEDDELSIEVMNIHENEYLSEFEGITRLDEFEGSDYYLEMLSGMNINYAVMLLGYAIEVNACDADKLDDLINAATGKYIDEIKFDSDNIIEDK